MNLQGGKSFKSLRSPRFCEDEAEEDWPKPPPPRVEVWPSMHMRLCSDFLLGNYEGQTRIGFFWVCHFLLAEHGLQAFLRVVRAAVSREQLCDLHQPSHRGKRRACPDGRTAHSGRSIPGSEGGQHRPHTAAHRCQPASCHSSSRGECFAYDFYSAVLALGQRWRLGRSRQRRPSSKGAQRLRLLPRQDNAP